MREERKWTDNRGNEAALNKLMTTRYPASALLTEMSAYFKRVRIEALVEWTPKSANREADALANGDTSGFHPGVEVKIDDRFSSGSFSHRFWPWGRKLKRLFTPRSPEESYKTGPASSGSASRKNC